MAISRPGIHARSDAVVGNKVQLIGNLGMNPEVKELDGGKKVAKFTLATNETYKNQQGDKNLHKTDKISE